MLFVASSNKLTSSNENICKKTPAVGGQERIDNTVKPAELSTSNKSARISTAVLKKHTESKHVQTDKMNKETLIRFESSIDESFMPLFCKIMDILTSGYGKFNLI